MEPHRHRQPARHPTRPPGDPIPEQPGRCARFLARLDPHLAGLASDGARRSFIERQLEAWQRRYGRFVATQGACEGAVDTADPPQAADFLLTIAALAARRRALAQRDQPGPNGVNVMTKPRPPAPISSPDENKQLDGALRSLLVAADQRCPAIIGQAHMLYHGRPGIGPGHAETTIAQLKRDADDLIRAIAEVEAAMRP
jgi:hypothetical protein